MKAAVLNKIVVDVQEKEYECHSSITWVDCDDKVKHGWTYDGKIFKTDEPTFTADDKLKKLQSERNMLLQQTDWTQNRDVTLSNDADWKTYRQALRDITDSATSLDDVTWPEKP
jgi:hypothetical protein